MTDKRFLRAALVLAASCGSHGAKSDDWQLPPQVSPPYGLDRIHGGMTVVEAQATEPELVASTRDGADVLALSRGVGNLINVRLEGGRTGDVVLQGSECAARISQMTQKWGQARHVKELLAESDVWSDARTGWAASATSTAQGCLVVFTHRDYFGSQGKSPPSVDAAPPGSVLATSAATKWVSPGLFQRPVTVVIDPVSRVVASVDVQLSTANMDALHMRWGNGVPMDGAEAWIDPAARRRAILSATPGGGGHLSFEAYVPFEAWIGADKTLLPIPTDILGRSLADLQASSAPLHRDAEPSQDFPDGLYSLALPRTEWVRGQSTHAPLTFTAGRLTKISFDVPCRDSADCDAKGKLLDERWGAASDAAPARRYRSGSTTLSVSQTSTMMSFDVSLAER